MRSRFKPAPVSVCMIAKNASTTLPICLRSFRPFVEHIAVLVDDASTDNTTKAARKAGADIIEPFRMLEEHTCPSHGTIQVQHFAKARQKSFERIHPDSDFALWIDSDDVLEGAELLPEFCAALPADCLGAWLLYCYAYSIEQGKRLPNTIFHRERLLRTHFGGRRIRWQWTHRVHEVVAPAETIEAKWAMPENFGTRFLPLQIVHQDGQHKTEHSAARNLTLLEIDYEQDPNDKRTIFYLGNQHFALGHWQQAAGWYDLVLQRDENPYQRWQAACYLAKAFQQMGDLAASRGAALEAIATIKDHAEPYFDLAKTALLEGRYDKVIEWTNEGRARTVRPPFFCFVNPLDISFNQRVTVADALTRMGQITRAREEYEAAYAVMPNEQIMAAIKDLRKSEANMNHATALGVLLARAWQEGGDDAVISLFETLDPPLDVRAHGRVRDLVMPAYLRRREHRLAA